MLGSPAVLLYDGDCGFCDATVQFFLARTRANCLLFAPLQSTFAQRRLAEYGVSDPDLSVAYLLTENGLHAARSAILEATTLIEGPLRYLSILRIVPAAIRDVAYQAIATHRKQLIAQISVRTCCTLSWVYCLAR